MAALLARQSGQVLTVEKYESLAAMAQENLNQAGISNVEVVQANGLEENPRWAHVGFDAIVVSGSVERLPEHLVARLNPGGRLVAIVGQAPVMQAVLVERIGAGLSTSSNGLRTTVLFETLTKPLEDAPKISHFKF